MPTELITIATEGAIREYRSADDIVGTGVGVGRGVAVGSTVGVGCGVIVGVGTRVNVGVGTLVGSTAAEETIVSTC